MHLCAWALECSAVRRACDIGTFESSKGICETCPSGFYQNDIRQTKCVECALGESYINAETACCACDIGTFESSKGICKACPSGFYQNNIHQTKCVECASGECTSMPKQHAVLVTLVRLKAAKVFVKLVRPGSIKIPKVKKSAVILAPHQQKYPTAKVPGANCHRGVPAKWANIYTTPTKTTMRGNVLPVPTVRIAQQSILLRHPPINADITHPDQKAGP